MSTPDLKALLVAAQGLLSFGCSVLPVTADKKPVIRSWKQYQTTPATQADIEAWFKDGALGGQVTGIGIILGEVSGDLVVRDFDDPDSYARWKAAHPELAATLPAVQTGRGFHVYARILDCKTRKLGDGELRANGAYVVAPPSMHLSGLVYKWIIPLPKEQLQVLDAKVFLESPNLDIHKSHNAIWRVCPEDPASPESPETPVHLDSPRPLDTLKALNALDNPETLAALVYGKETDRFISEAIRASVPKGVGRRNDGIFEFARRLKAHRDLANLKGLELRTATEWWFEAARKTVSTKDWDTTWADFLHAWSRVTTPYGKSMEAVIEQARQEPDPDCSAQFESTQTLLLIRICKVLQKLAGDNPFYLSARAAGEAIHLDKDTSNKRIGLLRETGILDRITKGHTGRSSEYRYLGD
jgi:hypothetical protein